MDTYKKTLGPVTAYRYAVKGGYSGTEQEFIEMLGNASVAIDELENMTATAETLEPGSDATAVYSEGNLAIGIPKGEQGIRGLQGETGNGIQSISLNPDYTLTISYTDGSEETVGPIRGAKGEKGETGETGEIGESGATFVPTVSEFGVLSWINDKHMQNPNSVDLIEIAGSVNRVFVNGTDPYIEAKSNTRYECGVIYGITFIPPDRGTTELMFRSGSSKTVLSLPNTVRMPEWFLIEANRIYEISITDGVYGAVMSWPLT